MSFHRYNTNVKEFNLGRFGTMQYAQWGHPLEAEKTFSESQIELLRKYIPEGSVIIDIGAHTGDTTIPFSIAAGKGGFTIGFEPNPAVFAVLMENARINSIEGRKILASNYAITDVKSGIGLYTFHYSDEDLCNGGYMDSLATGVGTGGHWWPCEVKGINLNEWFYKHHPDLINRISFIKIDAEGFDAQIISSIGHLINVAKPVIQTELYDGLVVEERIKLWETLTALGYSIYDFSAAQKNIDLLGKIISFNDIINMKTRSGHDLICFYGGLEEWKKSKAS